VLGGHQGVHDQIAPTLPEMPNEEAVFFGWGVQVGGFFLGVVFGVEVLGRVGGGGLVVLFPGQAPKIIVVNCCRP